ncbi:MAG TPA: DUF6266 family protein [Ferruginibacter sp.]|nr:DUF6266 family protein [Ferruginibacter sp.]
MGKYQKGINGSFRGLIGTAVGSKWNGIEYMRSRPARSGKPPSQKQRMQHARFSLVQRFVSSMGSLFSFSFDGAGNGKSGANIAFTQIYRNALSGLYPTYGLDYAQALVSKGGLLNAGAPAASAAGNGMIKVTWTDNSGVAYANATDKSIIVVHCPGLQKSTYSLDGATRSSGLDTINVNAFTGKTVHTWLTFISDDEAEIATSVYTGEVVVS